jgi:hypothetical protein
MGRIQKPTTLFTCPGLARELAWGRAVRDVRRPVWEGHSLRAQASAFCAGTVLGFGAALTALWLLFGL